MTHLRHLILFLAFLTTLPMAAQRRGTPAHSLAHDMVFDALALHPRARQTAPMGYNPYRYDAPSRYISVRLGVSAATTYSDDERVDGDDERVGITAGVMGGVQLIPDAPIYLEGGVLYTQKGGKADSQEMSNYTFALNYIEVPLVLKYAFYLDDDLTFEPFAGGFVACGVGGNIKNYGTHTSEKSFSDNRFKRLDSGIRLGVSTTICTYFYLEAAYDWGLANINQDAFKSTHTSNFTFTLGLNF